MERALPCALLLFLLGGTAGETGDGTCLGPYGTPLPHHPLQCPGRLDGSGESSLHGAPDLPRSPGKARCADPLAEESSRTWALISGIAAEEVNRSSTRQKGEQCHKWVHGLEDPTETFRCPTERNHPKDLFCCGTCTAPYCCSSAQDRLVQARCSVVLGEREDRGEGASPGPSDPRIFLRKGEQCQKWVPGQADPVETFRCPTQPNHVEDWFCCGTCTAPYCCSSQKDRLEQARCREVMEETGDLGAGESAGPSDDKTDPGIFLKKGEQCQKWVPGKADPVETFRCPTQPNHVEDWFCCGTCTAPYCCSSRKDRLEQARCPEVMEETGDRGAGESAGPSDDKTGTLSIIEFVLIAVGLVCICIGISYILRRVQVWIIIQKEQRAGHGQPNVVREFPARPAVGHPARPNPPSLVAEESPRRPQLPLAVTSPPDGSGSPMVEMTQLPAALPEGNLELPAEEEDLAC